MAPVSRRRSVVRSAIDSIARRIAAMPPSPEVDAFNARAEACRQEADAWTSSEPGAREKELLMKRLLELHIEVLRAESAK
jgi:hypothetical protein